MEKIKVEKRTEEDWIEIFKTWSDKMDELYPITDEDKGKESPVRNDATEWADNPGHWMEEYKDNEYYNESVFCAWCEWDGKSPFWYENFKHLIIEEE